MNVYVETNFILELAFEQEQQIECELILNLCEMGKIKLIVLLSHMKNLYARQIIVKNCKEVLIRN